MTGSTKILTVSYGTFSCTLEGFDDPFATMRGIAEYFRDLAADDRYFGAEPPTPDVEMLQSIASRSTRRSVTAERSETGIALTQVEDAEPAPADAPETTETDSGDDVANVTKRAAAALAGTALNAAGEDALDHGPLALDDDYLMADEPEDILAVDPAARINTDGPAESVAEKLRRIRAVVSRSIEQEDTSPFSAADGTTAEPKRDRAQTSTIESIAADLAAEDEVDLYDEEAEAPHPDSDDIATADVSNDGADYDVAEESADQVLTDAVARLKREIEEQTPDADEIGAASEIEDDVADRDAQHTADETEEQFDGSATDEGHDVEADVAPESIVAETVSDEESTADADDSSEPDVPEDDTPVQESDAFEYREGEDEGGEDEGADDDENGDDEMLAAIGRRISTPLAPLNEKGDDVGRILTETDSKLREDENVRRRRVISQMRAAVAATKADRLISRRVTSKELDENAEQGPYRADLSDAVSSEPPRTAREVSHDRDASRSTGKAPLVLVSSQRVDQVEQGRIIVTPQRIDRSEMPQAEESETSESFANFADTMGASELTELLEAAAAYTTFVEGNASFSRPEIMKRVARYDPALRLTREDGLRSFGQLLRQGTLKKIERGQFAISHSSRFNPGQKIAGE